MGNTRTRTFAIISILLLFTSATLGCTLFGEEEEEKPPKGFAFEELQDTIPHTTSYEQPTVETAPEIDLIEHQPISKIIASWYFEKNIIYTYFGGTLKLFIQNNGTEQIYVYNIGLKPNWPLSNRQSAGDDDIIFADTGKYVNASEKEYVGLLYFPGPTMSGEFDYNIVFSVYRQNSTGAWLDRGLQEGVAKSFSVFNLPAPSEYNEHYNLRQYYDKINNIVDPTHELVINLAHSLAGEYSGPFNIYQVCNIFDYISTNVKYISDPSNNENYWCRPEQTLEFGGDCEDYSTLFASMLISIGGTVRMYLTDSHAFIGVYIGSEAEVRDITEAIRDYYWTDVQLFWFTDELGVWLVLDTIGSLYPGGLPLGAGPIIERISDTAGEKSLSWDFIETENLYIIDVIPKE
jgi:hypothetical protein